MWDTAVTYLESVAVLDFKGMLQKWAQQERLGAGAAQSNACVFAAGVVREGAGQVCVRMRVRLRFFYLLCALCVYASQANGKEYLRT